MIICFTLAFTRIFSQHNDIRFGFKDVVLKIDTLQFRYSKDLIYYQAQSFLSFMFDKQDWAFLLADGGFQQFGRVAQGVGSHDPQAGYP